MPSEQSWVLFFGWVWGHEGYILQLFHLVICQGLLPPRIQNGHVLENVVSNRIAQIVLQVWLRVEQN